MKLKYDKLLSCFAFTFNWRPYILAPCLRVAAHWFGWVSHWRGLRGQEGAMRLSGLCGHMAGTDVTLLALLILSWRMGDTSRAFSAKQGGCIAGDCFRITAGHHRAMHCLPDCVLTVYIVYPYTLAASSTLT